MVSFVHSRFACVAFTFHRTNLFVSVLATGLHSMSSLYTQNEGTLYNFDVIQAMNSVSKYTIIEKKKKIIKLFTLFSRLFGLTFKSYTKPATYSDWIQYLGLRIRLVILGNETETRFFHRSSYISTKCIWCINLEDLPW